MDSMNTDRRERDKAIAEEYAQGGMSLQKIGDKYGLSHEGVRRIVFMQFKNHGIGIGVGWQRK